MSDIHDNMHFTTKADLEVATLVSGGGYLVTEQSQKFMELLILASKFLQLITTKPMSGPSFEISKMGFTGTVLRGANENRALSVADRSRPEFQKVVLQTQEFIAEARIPYGVLEDNIEHGTFINSMQAMLSKAVSRDLEKMTIQGDTTSSDPLLAKMDGFLKQAATIVYNAGGVRLGKGILKVLMQLMPKQYFDPTAMGFFTGSNAAIDFADSVANRPTALGDSAFQKASIGSYMNVGVVSVPLFPQEIVVSAQNTTNVILCDPKNATIGIQREIRIETAKDISAREYIIVATLRADAKWAHEPAVAKATNVLASAGL